MVSWTKNENQWFQLKHTNTKNINSWLHMRQQQTKTIKTMLSYKNIHMLWKMVTHERRFLWTKINRLFFIITKIEMNRTRFIQQKHTQLKSFVRHAKTETNDGVILEPNEKTKDKHGFHIQQNIDKNIDGCFLFLKKINVNKSIMPY